MYEELLKRAVNKVPKKTYSKTRFVIPKTVISMAGAKTIINNFYIIADTLRRDPKHLLKFLLKELATKGEISDKKLIVLGNFPSDQVDKKIDLYVKNYVLCPECGKPDTKMVKENKVTFLVCEACGSRHSLG